MVTAHALFVAAENGTFEPTEYARSGWSEDMVNGPALVGLAAWSLEREFEAVGFRAVRFTADLFRAARKLPTGVRTRMVRDGRRIRINECELLQNGVAVARATMVQFRASGPPPGREWVGPEPDFSPPTMVDICPDAYLVGSDDAGWSSSVGLDDGVTAHQNASRKRVYHSIAEVVAGNPATPFVRAVVAAEATSLVTNLGTKGIGYINADLTVALSRPPVGDHIGLQADSHWCAEGISVGSATLFDDLGPFGLGVVTALANPAAQIDFGRLKPSPALNV